MGTITINVKNETEKKFRKIAGARYGKRKGALGEAVTEALDLWTRTNSKKSVIKAMELLEKGIDMGKLKYKSRDELHER